MLQLNVAGAPEVTHTDTQPQSNAQSLTHQAGISILMGC